MQGLARLVGSVPLDVDRVQQECETLLVRIFEVGPGIEELSQLWQVLVFNG
ncbi:hypothetical protein B0E53_06427 [Micromonospora sp. MH33]|uniref:hypothetical protein n=1 Tax=Micromonospora sp. MH33 TaxID=1945509 RepID=UPI000D261328|nr:hypothetical protein [Micromonospora sp. MH33]PSK61672.1 hypothetical protein B0E53_06427 [Micromonospora sp. MH33]